MTPQPSLTPQSRILVVDDSKADLARASMLLSKNSDWEIYTVPEAVSALELIDDQLPDLVVTDLQMPEMNGLELLNALQRSHPKIPVLIMTGAGSDKIAIECLNQGASSYVPKSELANMLVETVNRLLSQKKKNHERGRLLTQLEKVSYKIDNDLRLINAVVLEMSELIRVRKAFPEMECFRIVTAIDEALRNAYYHGNLEVSSKLREQDSGTFHDLANLRLTQAPFRDRQIGIELQFSALDLSVSIQDEGEGFDVSTVPDPTEDMYLDRPHGRGILLMKTFMDDVQFNSSGNQVHMIKRIVMNPLRSVLSKS